MKNMNESKLKFSVLIPVYNTEQYLEECLQSILKQTYKNFEIVLIDDGSTDKSVDICDAYSEKYPGKIKAIHRSNQGQLASRCCAVLEARGDYVLFADADDLLVENALEIIKDNLEKYDFPDMIIYSFIYEEKTGGRKADKLFDEGLVEKDKLYRLFFTGTGLNNVWTKAVKRGAALCKGFDFSPYFKLRCSEDKLHSMVMADRCQSAAYIYKQLYRYRLFEGSVTRTYRLENIEKFNSVPIYGQEKAFLNKWDLELPEWQFRMDAQWAYSVIHILGLFYGNNKGKDRKGVIKYDWTKLLSIETVADIPDNPYINQTCKKIWKWIVEKKYSNLYLHYAGKSFRRKIKNLKKR